MDIPYPLKQYTVHFVVCSKHRIDLFSSHFSCLLVKTVRYNPYVAGIICGNLCGIDGRSKEKKQQLNPASICCNG